MASLKEPFDDYKKVLQQYLLQSGLDERWWSDSYGMLLLSSKRPRPPGRWENSVRKTIWRTTQRPNNTFLEHWLNITRFQHETKQEIDQFGKKVLPGIFLGCEFVAGGNLERRYSDLEDFEKLDASDIYPRRINAKEVLIRQEDEEFMFPFADGTAKLSENFMVNRESLNRQKQKMTLKPVPTSGRFKVTSSIVNTKTLEFNSTSRRKKHFLFH